MINSRAKGKRGELAAAAFLRRFLDHKGKPVQARRGQQYAGGPDSADLVTSINVYFEVKYGVASMDIGSKLLEQAWLQAIAEYAPGKFPCVLWKPLHTRRWRISYDVNRVLVTADAEQWLISEGYHLA